MRRTRGTGGGAGGKGDGRGRARAGLVRRRSIVRDDASSVAPIVAGTRVAAGGNAPSAPSPMSDPASASEETSRIISSRAVIASSSRSRALILPPVHDARLETPSSAPGRFFLGPSSATRAPIADPDRGSTRAPATDPGARSTGSTGRTSRRPAAPVAVPRRRPRPDPIVSVCRRFFRPLGVERTSRIVRHPVLKDEGATISGKVPATRRRVRGGEKRGFANRQKKKRACRFSRLSVRVVGNFGASDGSFLGVAGVGCWVPRLFSARFPRTSSIASARARRRSSARGGTGVFRVPSFPRWRTESYGGTCSPPRRACSFARSVRSWCSSSCP